jgi:nucleotide-binding universal stress UspA family protein
MKILVAVDGSAFTKRMLAYLTAHDEWLGAAHQYTVIHCVQAVPSRAATVLGSGVLKDHYASEAERVFKPIRAFLNKQGIAVEWVVKVGTPAEHIAVLADKGQFDLLIMGSHGHGVLANLALGSVAVKVMAQCKAPTLIIR